MPADRISVFRLTITGAFVLLILFVLCWIGAAIGLLPGAHMYIGLFTATDVSSGAALLEGGLWSLAWGAIAGALVAGIYNLLGVFGRGAPLAER